MAEQAFTEELAKLVSHLTERLSGTGGYKPCDRLRKAIRQQSPELIERAEGLRELLGKTNDLLTALKQQRRQSRLVRSTLASLRELETVAG